MSLLLLVVAPSSVLAPNGFPGHGPTFAPFYTINPTDRGQAKVF